MTTYGQLDHNVQPINAKQRQNIFNLHGAKHKCQTAKRVNGLNQNAVILSTLVVGVKG